MTPKALDFNLKSEMGPISLNAFRGKVVLMYFGFTSCPDACPTMLNRISIALRKLPPEQREKVVTLFVSLDPERDTFSKLKAYAAHFKANVLPLTGTQDELQKILKFHGASFEKIKIASEMSYTIDHTTELTIINPSGEVAAYLPDTTTPQGVYEKICSILGIKADSPETQTQTIVGQSAVIQVPPPGAPAAVGLVTIKNNLNKTLTLIGADIEGAKNVEIHEMKKVNGYMKMRAIDNLTILSKQTLNLSGEHHLMVFGAENFKAGERKKLRLFFMTGEKIELEAEVK